jgi:hypothetical protein
VRRNEWWAVCHKYSGLPCCSGGAAALFETRRMAETYKRALPVPGSTRIVKVTVTYVERKTR